MNNNHYYTDDLQFTEKLKKSKPINQLNENLTPEELENLAENINSKLEAEEALRRKGIKVLGMSSGDVLLLAAGHGLINVIKFFESPSYPVTYTNAFGDSLLHYAA